MGFMRVLIAGGGTGGHIYPGIAIARYLSVMDKEAEIVFVGTKTGMEADIVAREGFSFKAIKAQGWSRKVSFKTASMILNNSLGVVQSLQIIKRFKPQVVLGTGGYVAAPLVFSAALLKIPVVLHEQNAVPGIANRLLSRWATKIALSFPESAKHFPSTVEQEVTGNPVRQAILDGDRNIGLKNLRLNTGKKTVLVFGGSRGARSINNAIIEGAERLAQTPNLQLIHLTGREEYESVLNQLTNKGIELDLSGNIVIKPYLYEMADALAAADLVICRAGATTLAELTAIGRASILIPYPYATDNHQEKNARSLENAGAAYVIRDKELTGKVLTDLIIKLISDTDSLKRMAENSRKLGKPDAAARIAKCLRDAISNR
jgi:UDP-N-acetylglucosamine--N-acetylmuramyl-(pentapeptide) pyrophosphoryl-undecaprenol N-acetylglucosamine transferase